MRWGCQISTVGFPEVGAVTVVANQMEAFAKLHNMSSADRIRFILGTKCLFIYPPPKLYYCIQLHGSIFAKRERKSPRRRGRSEPGYNLQAYLN